VCACAWPLLLILFLFCLNVFINDLDVCVYRWCIFLLIALRSAHTSIFMWWWFFTLCVTSKETGLFLSISHIPLICFSLLIGMWWWCLSDCRVTKKTPNFAANTGLKISRGENEQTTVHSVAFVCFTRDACDWPCMYVRSWFSWYQYHLIKSARSLSFSSLYVWPTGYSKRS